MDVDKAFQEQRDSMMDAVKDSLRAERLRGVVVQAMGNDAFEVKTEQPQALSHVRKYLQEIIEAGRFVKAQISCKFSHHNK